MLVLFSDTDTDMTPEIAEQYGYRLISMPYSIDGKTIRPWEDFSEFDFHEYYDRLRSGCIPTTSAVNVEEYIKYFEPVFANGDDILYVHFSRAMSTTFGNMDKALEILMPKYPERKFYAVDTKGINILSLNIAMEVSDKLRAGEPLEDVLAWAEEEKYHFAVYYFADDLTFFKRSGRVSGLAGTMGTLLGIRPIINMGADGKMVSIGKEKGRAKAIERLVKYVEELGDDVAGHRVLISHADIPDVAEQISSMLKERISPDLDIQIVNVNPTSGSHCGPSSIGVCFHAVHR